MVWGERRPRREVPEQFQALAPARRVAGAVPLRQGSQGSRFMGGQVFVLGQGGDRLQEQPEQRCRRRRAKETTRGPMECAGIFQKVGLWLVLVPLTAGKEV